MLIYSIRENERASILPINQRVFFFFFEPNLSILKEFLCPKMIFSRYFLEYMNRFKNKAEGVQNILCLLLKKNMAS